MSNFGEACHGKEKRGHKRLLKQPGCIQPLRGDRSASKGVKFLSRKEGPLGGGRKEK